MTNEALAFVGLYTVLFTEGAVIATVTSSGEMDEDDTAELTTRVKQLGDEDIETFLDWVRDHG